MNKLSLFVDQRIRKAADYLRDIESEAAKSYYGFSGSAPRQPEDTVTDVTDTDYNVTEPREMPTEASGAGEITDEPMRTEPPRADTDPQKTLAMLLSLEKDGIRKIEERDVLAIVITNDHDRLSAIVPDSVDLTSFMNNVAVETKDVVSHKRNARILYADSFDDALAMASRPGRSIENTFVFADTGMISKNSASRQRYDELRTMSFVIRLNVPPTSYCGVSPLAFLLYSLKFNEILERAREMDGAAIRALKSSEGWENVLAREWELEALARIKLLGTEEKADETSIGREMARLYPFIDALTDRTSPIELSLKEFSGAIVWDLPSTRPENWEQAAERFMAMKQAYVSL